MTEGDEVGGMTKLPEGCISHFMSLTTPRDCCRSAAVSAAFRSAAESDTVWERFLPSDLSEILSRAVDTVDSFSPSKRDLYFRLCNSILIDGARMSFSLERSTGRKCYTLSARELLIVRGDTPNYWRWGPHQDSRFPEVAEMMGVRWLEIRGKLSCRILSQRTSYGAYLIFKLAEDSYNLNFTNEEASVRVGNHVSENTVCLQPHDAGQRSRSGCYAGETRVVGRAPRGRHDGWMEMELGEFFNGDGDDGEVEISLLEVKAGRRKRGLIVLGIQFQRPYKPVVHIIHYAHEWVRANELLNHTVPGTTLYIALSPPTAGCVKLNTDGKCAANDQISAGGLIRDKDGSWLVGYYKAIGCGTSLLAEIWGLYEGLKIAWPYGYNCIEVECDDIMGTNVLKWNATLYNWPN